MTLRIAHLTDERYPSDRAESQQIIKTADALGGIGWDVHLIQPRAASRYFKSRAELKQELCQVYNVAGRFEVDDIHHIPGSDLRIEKPFHVVLGAMKAFMGKYDVVMTRNLMTLTVGTLLGLPMVYETHLALPVTSPKVARVVHWAVSRPNVLGMVTHSTYAAEAMRKQSSNPASIAAIPNGHDPRDFESVPEKADARLRIEMSDGKPLAVYTGGIGPNKGTGTLLDLAQDVPDVNILLIGGPHDAVTLLQQEAAARGADNFTVLPHAPLVEVAKYLVAADVLLLPPSAMPLLRSPGNTVLPMKVFSYLAAGRPILAPDLPDTAELLIHNHNSWRVTPDNRAAAAAGLRQVVNDEPLRARLSAQALDDATRYTWDARAKRIDRFVRERIEIV